GGGITHRHAADVGGGTQVALHHGRRWHLHVGDVVEARADRVGGQIRADVDVESNQRPNGGGVVRAVEPLERSTPRVGVGRRRRKGEDRQLYDEHGDREPPHPRPRVITTQKATPASPSCQPESSWTRGGKPPFVFICKEHDAAGGATHTRKIVSISS